MRSTDERVSAVQMRSRALRQRSIRRRGLVISGASALASFAAIFGVAFFIPRAVDAMPAPSGASSAYGSIMASGEILGFVVIGLLSFCLGVTMTLLCIKLKERASDAEDDESDRP